MEHPSDQELHDQLLGYLAAEGEIMEDSDGVVITKFDHRVLRQPLRLRLTSTTFGEHLRRAASDAAALYPDLAPTDAAWRLFLVHLDEAVQTARSGETELIAVRGGVVTQRSDGTRTPLPHEVEEHIALNEWHERLINHYADRGEATFDVHREVLALRTLDGRTLDQPLHIHVATEEMRRQMRAANASETAWLWIVDQIDRAAAVVDPSEVELVLAEAGVVQRRL